ncbi:DUF4236 domain-containing protein [Posidoniimonas polymericola]|uniref:DUF4236 domain-containing protein n=1 Tax=Posidoniimonas polymericola TaxID=2528002 RepID=UPI0037038E6C
MTALGWRFRKQWSKGPLRWTLSKRGIGTSIGIPGLRFGRSSDGRAYFSFGLRGTGLYFVHYFGRWSVRNNTSSERRTSTIEESLSSSPANATAALNRGQRRLLQLRRDRD